jgi:hypothetical protein
MYVANAFIPGFGPFAMAWTVLRTRLAVAKDREAGYTTETIIITAMLAALALLAVGYIVTRVGATANNISTDGSGTPGAGG